jgi:hypothetical protein
VDGTALSYENQANGTTIITCEDGTKLIVTADGDSKPIKNPVVQRAARIAVAE